MRELLQCPGQQCRGAAQTQWGDAGLSPEPSLGHWNLGTAGGEVSKGSEKGQPGRTRTGHCTDAAVQAVRGRQTQWLAEATGALTQAVCRQRRAETGR